MQEPGVIAAVAKMVLMFKAGIGVGEHAPLFLPVMMTLNPTKRALLTKAVMPLVVDIVL